MKDSFTIGIDPSFSSTGIAVLKGNQLIDYERVTTELKIYDNFCNHHYISENICSVLERVIKDYPHADVICEYPSTHSISGASLMCLNGYIASLLNNNSLVSSVTYITPNAVNSYTQNKSKTKTHLVNWCKEHNLYNKQKGKSLNQDVCTAIILAKIFQDIQSGDYTKSYFTYKRKADK